MSKINKKIFFVLVLLLLLVVLIRCSDQPSQVQDSTNKYLNLHDTVKYVGMTTCRQCHQNIYNNFKQTGMGQSFDTASKAKSAGDFTKHAVIHDKLLGFSYHPYWKGNQYFIDEFRLEGKDTVYKRTQKVDYIIGSGQHTNSHMYSSNGYIYQMPLTFYTQKKHWDLPPGYEKGANTRFSRKIGLECMSCHNAYPAFQLGSENKYNMVPQGINCERCHGPGEAHVKERITGSRVDTSKFIDYTIVNPGKLPVDLQFDVCQRCHLQGNAVLNEGKSFYDFKPGRKLSDVMTIFVNRNTGMDEEFIMASHVDRLKLSPCFKESIKNAEKSKSLRPYKEALTCVTCHDPHVSVTVTGKEVFNTACKNCHNGGKEKFCTEDIAEREKVQDNCFSCHMPKSGTIDIPHVTTTDHYIRKPVTKQETEKIKEFISLVAVNNDSPSRLIKAKGYINQYDKFTKNSVFLDSAANLLKYKDKKELVVNFEHLTHLNFIKKEYQRIADNVEELGADYLLTKKLNSKSWDNQNAWTCYRIGESYQNLNLPDQAFLFYKRAVELSPYNPDFQNKLGSSHALKGSLDEAKSIFENIIKEDPSFAPAYSNLGYLELLNGNIQKAEELYNKALALDPDYEQALFNKVGLYIYTKNTVKAAEILNRMLKKNPANSRAAEILRQLKNV